MEPDNEFRDTLLVATALLEQATRDQLIEALKLISLNYGYLAQHHGDVPQEVLVQMTRAESLTEEAKAMVLTGMRNLAGLMGNVMELDNETLH